MGNVMVSVNAERSGGTPRGEAARGAAEGGDGIFAISYGLSQGRIFRRVTAPAEWAARSPPFSVILFAIYFSGGGEKLLLNSRGEPKPRPTEIL